MGNGVTGIETSLGVGDDIYLAAAGLGDYFLNLVSKLGGAFRYRSGGLLFAVIEDGAVAGEFFWDSPPIVDELPVPKENTVDQQNRIAGGADLIFFPQRIALLLGKVETVLCLHQSAGPPKEKKVDHRAPPQTDEQDTQRQPQPSGGKDDAEKAVGQKKKEEEQRKGNAPKGTWRAHACGGDDMGKIDQVKPQNGHTQPGGSHEELITSHHDLQTPRDTRAAFPAGPEIEEQKKDGQSHESRCRKP